MLEIQPLWVRLSSFDKPRPEKMNRKINPSRALTMPAMIIVMSNLDKNKTLLFMEIVYHIKR